jgi:hypothetical protein
MNNTDLLNKSQLAERLGRSKGYVSAMVKAGFTTPCGRTTLKAAMQWMAENPDFRVADAYRPRVTNPVTSRRKSASGTRQSVLA